MKGGVWSTERDASGQGGGGGGKGRRRAGGERRKREGNTCCLCGESRGCPKTTRARKHASCGPAPSPCSPAPASRWTVSMEKAGSKSMDSFMSAGLEKLWCDRSSDASWLEKQSAPPGANGCGELPSPPSVALPVTPSLKTETSALTITRYTTN